MIKILFFIHNMEDGGAQKVLTSLVNNMDQNKFDITVTSLFGGGVSEQFLKSHIHYRTVFPRAFPGNSKVLKLFSPQLLHRLFIREHFDIEVSYLEGVSARIVSGCQDPNTKLVCWIHSTLANFQDASGPFRTVRETQNCYGRYQKIICVSQWSKRVFSELFPGAKNVDVLYNTVESDQILAQSTLPVPDDLFCEQEIDLITVGSLKSVKAFDRLIRIHSRLRKEGYPVHTYFLGQGPDLEKLQQQAAELGESDTVSFLGYDSNPYKYVARSDLFVCCSLSEGFSTAVTEALIVGTPVCTVEVSGMKEMLGENNEWGIVTENSEEALYQGIKGLLDHLAMFAKYKEKAAERGKMFNTENTVKAVEDMLQNL